MIYDRLYRVVVFIETKPIFLIYGVCVVFINLISNFYEMKTKKLKVINKYYFFYKFIRLRAKIMGIAKFINKDKKKLSENLYFL
jgi:hypothetical protein